MWTKGYFRLLQALIYTLTFSGLLHAQVVTTVAGGWVGDGGPATNAAFGANFGLVQDAKGNFYTADFLQNRIRKIAPNGTISTYAGTGFGGFSGDGGPASQAMLLYPNGLAFDSAGNLIVADGGNGRIRKIDAVTQVITTIAGTGELGYSGDGGPAIDASFRQPYSIAYDSAGNLYISDIGNYVVRRIDTGGIINTVAGNGTFGFSGDGGPATQAQMGFVRGVGVDSQSNLYICDPDNHRVRKVDGAGTITTFAGTGENGFSGDGGPATEAKVGRPRGLLAVGNIIFIANAGRARVRTVNTSSGIINTFAGSVTGYDGDHHGLLLSEFSGPYSMLFDLNGNFVIADSFNARVRRASGGEMTTIGGGYTGDGKAATAAAFNQSEAFNFDSSGNLYVAEANGNRVRKVNTTGKITTIAGTGVTGYSGDGGPAVSATLSFTFGVAADSRGNVFISDQFNNVVRKVDTAGTISTFATNGNFSFLGPMATDTANNLYVSDSGTCVIWKVTPAGSVSVVAGTQFACGYNGDNLRATSAELNQPFGVAVDVRGNLYIADTFNNRIRKVNSAGFITTIAGDGNCGFTGDGGAATSAELCNPYGVAVSSSGVVYVADTVNARVRKIAAGTITTFAGTGVFGYNGDGLPALSTNFDEPLQVAVDPQQVVYVLDDFQLRVRKIR